MQKILFVASEAMPFAATGGLGDVLGSLPTAIANAAEGNADVRVVMPYYGTMSQEWKDRCETDVEFYVDLSWRKQYCGVKKLEKDGVTYYFIDNEYYFNRKTLYGEFDDGERFAFFSLAAIEMMRHIDFYPDVLHAHDWQSALSVVYLKLKYSHIAEYSAIKTLFTIHNIEYQGKYDPYLLGGLFGLSNDAISIMEYGGCANLMKGAIVLSDKVSTVSPRYSEEIKGEEYSHGLHHILNAEADKLCGILNGIDYDYYNPVSDNAIASKFSWRSLAKKAINKKALQEEIGLDPRDDVPMLAIISRLVAHKGIDIVRECIYNVIENTEVQLVILGKGEEEYERFFCELQDRYPNRVKALMAYDRNLAKRIYAACDIFVMPSKSEPCGLSQMIASRYGAIPVIRETGGLYDSIKPYEERSSGISGNGFTFADYRADALEGALRAAISLWYDTAKREKRVGRIMRTDFSWKKSALTYLRLYESL